MDGVVNFFTHGDMGGGVNITDPGSITDGIKRLLDELKDDLMREVVDVLKRVIWDPIDEGLVQPSARFFQMITDYSNCVIDKIQNFWGCFFWYVIYLIQETLHLIVVGIISILNMLTGTDLFKLYNQALDGWGWASDKCLEYTGFELFIYPYSNDINNRCFTCTPKNYGPTKLATLTKDFKNEIKEKTGEFRNFTKSLVDDIA